MMIKDFRSVLVTCLLSSYYAFIIVSGFNADEKSPAAIPIASVSHPSHNNEIDLFAWAKQNGARIADSIEIKTTSYGGRGLFAKRHIPANTELIQIPYHLQLGIRQLAEGNDKEMQNMARILPWKFVMENELFFLPLSIALAAERRKGEDSTFWPFFISMPECDNAVSGHCDIDLSDLLIWAPNVAKIVKRRRLGVQEIYDLVAPSSLSINELRWAATNVCSRSLIRKRIKELTSDQVNKVGEFCSSDHSRMLPIIDLVNHGSLALANVLVGHISHYDGETNDFSTSLKSLRDIAAGEELLFDYGGNGVEKISNDRLLLDYGFILPDHMAGVSISLEELSSAISEMLDMNRLNDVPVSDRKRLNYLIALLVKQVPKSQQDIPISFASNDEPTIHAHAITICMTCRLKDDVVCLLNLLGEIESRDIDMKLLPNQIVKGCSDLQREFARYTLKVAAGLALAQRAHVSKKADEKNKFVRICRSYSKMCCESLQRVADMSR